jgi:hypothetical protein
MRGTDQQPERNVQLFDLVHRLGLDVDFVRLLGDLMIAAAIPATTNVSKSISSFWSCGASGLRWARDSSSDFPLGIGSSSQDAEPTRSDITRPAIILPSDPRRRSVYDLVDKALQDQPAGSEGVRSRCAVCSRTFARAWAGPRIIEHVPEQRLGPFPFCAGQWMRTPSCGSGSYAMEARAGAASCQAAARRAVFCTNLHGQLDVGAATASRQAACRLES